MEGKVGLALGQRDFSALLHDWGALGGLLLRTVALNIFRPWGEKQRFFAIRGGMLQSLEAGLSIVLLARAAKTLQVADVSVMITNDYSVWQN